MPQRIDVTTIVDSARPRISVNGIPQPDSFPLRWHDVYGSPITAIYIADDRQYDTEIWIDGNLRHRVPPKSSRVDAAYDEIERGRSAAPNEDQQDFDASLAPSLDQLRSEMADHPGQIAWLRWEGLRRSVDVHSRNSQELGRLLEAIAVSEDLAVEMFQNVRPPHVRLDIEAQIDQRLHNYVASSGSLIDHTRRLFQHYRGSELAKEYERRKAVVVGSEVARFINDLRNYTLHHELPFIGYTVSFGAEMKSVAAEIELSTGELLKWDGWKAPARSMLSSSGDAISLRDTLKEHVALVRDLYTWVLDQFHALHRDDLNELDRIREEFNWVLSGGVEGRPRELR